MPAPAFRGVDNGPRDVTLRQLLGHTAGLGTYARIHYGDARPGPTLDAVFARHGTLVQEPGRVAEYSNLGYGVLGTWLEQRSGRPFADVVADTVFRPLGMADAFVGEPGNGRAAAVRYGGAGERLPPLHNDTPGAGNAWASARDLLRFGAFHLPSGHAGGIALDRAAVARMQQVADAGALQHYYGDAVYGLGWYVRTGADGRREVWHEGGMPGASTLLRLYPDEGVVIAVLANRTDVNALAQAIADAATTAVLPDARPAPLDPVAGYSPFAGQAEFVGHWTGEVHIDGVARACSLELRADGTTTVALPGAAGETIRVDVGARVDGDSFISALPGRLPARDLAGGDTPFLLLKLVRTGDTLTGAVVAYASPARLEHLLPFAVVMQREDAPR